MSHAFTPDPRKGYLNTATVADNALMFNAFVLTARAFPISGRTKDPLAEKASFLRFERSIIDRLRILYLTFTPRADGVRRRHADSYLVETDRAFFPKKFAKIRFIHSYDRGFLDNKMLTAARGPRASSGLVKTFKTAISAGVSASQARPLQALASRHGSHIQSGVQEGLRFTADLHV
jgi:hypothetical protein